jgi:SpoVK/Ycf46/Vps4 family AAA+-type ATPase
VLTFVRDVVASAPHLIDRSDELAAEGARLLISGMADAVPIHWTAVEALDACGGPTSNRFPTDLNSQAGWQALRMWKYRPSSLVTDLASAGDLVGAKAVLVAGVGAVLPGVTYASAGGNVADLYRAAVEYQLLALAVHPNLAAVLGHWPPVIQGLLAQGSDLTSRPGPQDEDREDLQDHGPDDSNEHPMPDVGGVAGVLAEVDRLVGLDAVKMQLRQITAVAEVDRRRRDEGMPRVPMGFHMVLTGNPGTGKTTVARLVGRLFSEMGVLSSGHLVEAAPADFIAKYVGQTEAKTRALLDRAAGGVLFIDEAYNLAPTHERDFGHEAISVLVAEMENRRDDLVVLAAGYGQEMHEFLDSNPGLRSRFSYTLDFPDLDDDALLSVFVSLIQRDDLEFDPAARDAVARALRRLPRGPGFGNAREARRLYEQTLVRQAARLVAATSAPLRTILAEDVPGGDPPSRSAADSVWHELDALVGLASVKHEIRTVGNVARAARLRRADGFAGGDDPVGHMVFTGNPGTGKTTVARLLGRALSALDALPSGHLVQVTRGDLVGEFIGQTAPKTRKAFMRALGGVLFVDEAYSLFPEDAARDFGLEALATLLPLMEDHRDAVVVVLAGYTNEMTRLLDANPGLRSRISRIINFDDFSPEEMTQIVLRLAADRDMRVTEEARERLARLMLSWPRDANFGNARTARSLFTTILERQANRLASFESAVVGDRIRAVEAEDVPEPPREPSPKPFGFQ